MAGKLVLCRHGQSEWNLKNLFTGWVDVDLTEKGVQEATEAGRLLRDLEYEFDIAYTSVEGGDFALDLGPRRDDDAALSDDGFEHGYREGLTHVARLRVQLRIQTHPD